MKKSWAIILALLLAILVPLASAEEGDELWLATFGGEHQDIGNGIASTLDDGFILTGATQSHDTGGFDIYLLKLASDGSVEWERSYSSDTDDIGHAVIQASDGGYLVAGRRQLSTYSSDGLVLKVAADGTEQWLESYSAGSQDEFRDVIASANGGYVLVGQSSSRMAWVVRLDQDGSTIWERTPDLGEPGFGHAQAVVETMNGDLMVAGYSGDDGVYPPFYKAKLARLDADGEVVWIQTYGNPYCLDDRAYDLVEVPGGGFGLTGRAWGDMVLWRTDAGGSLIWSRLVGTTESFESARSMTTTEDGGFLIVGQAYDLDAGYNGLYVGKIDEFGHVEWSRHYRAPGERFGHEVTTSVDGNYVILGTTEAEGSGEGDVLLLAIEGPDVVTAAYDLPVAVAVHPLIVFPNPFNPRTVIRFELTEPAWAVLEVLDVRGRVVRTLTGAVLSEGDHEFIWNGCDDCGHRAPSGTYVMRLRAGNTETASKVQLVK